MELSKEEVKALRTYFDETTINVTKFVKNIGLKEWNKIQQVIDKLYKEEDGKA